MLSLFCRWQYFDAVNGQLISIRNLKDGCSLKYRKLSIYFRDSKLGIDLFS